MYWACQSGCQACAVPSYCAPLCQAPRPESPTDKIPVYLTIGQTPKFDKPRVIILGSGWAAMSFIKALPKDIKYVSYAVWLVHTCLHASSNGSMLLTTCNISHISHQLTYNHSGYVIEAGELQHSPSSHNQPVWCHLLQ